MDISIRKTGKVQVIKLRGGLKLGPPVDELRGAFDALLNEGESRFVFDLAEVPMADSSGVGLLVRFQTSAKSRGGAVKLVAPAKLVAQTLKILGLLTVFEVLDDLNKAVESFATQDAVTPGA